MIIIGIDPGMDGAVVAIQGDTREIITVTDCPTLPAGRAGITTSRPWRRCCAHPFWPQSDRDT